MTLEIIPDEKFEMTLGEELVYEVDIRKELGDNTIDEITYDILNSAESSVTSSFGGGYTEDSGIITFGVKAYAVGEYTIKFTVTCEELLPDNTPNEFIVILIVTVNPVINS